MLFFRKVQHECSLDRQNTVMEKLGVSHIQGLKQIKGRIGVFLIRRQKPSHCVGVKDSYIL